MRPPRRNRPPTSAIIGMMLANAVLSFPILFSLLWLMGVKSILPPGFEKGPQLIRTSVVMLPGAGILFGCFWFWLTVTRRASGISWGAAAIYGLFLGWGVVVTGGAVIVVLHGQPALALLGALLSLITLALSPALLFSASLSGIVMGIINGYAAHIWIESRR